MSRPRSANRPVTAKDVAARAGVAVSSVSRVFTGHEDVSESMRLRVQRAAEELDYRPNLLARGLRRGETGTVGIMVRDISNPLFADIIKGAEARLQAAGFAALLANAAGGKLSDAEYIELLTERQVDGLIVSLRSETDEDTLRALEIASVPIVLLDREVVGVELPAVLCDHFTGMYDGVDHLLQLGHRRIAMIAGSSGIRATRERIRGYREAHMAHDIEPDPELIRQGSYGQTFGHEQSVELLTQARPTAIIAGGIELTLGALRAIHEAGLRVGEDLSFIACDDVPWLGISSPPVSVVTRSADRIGQTAANLLIEILSEDRRARVVPIATTYIRRSSATVPPHRS